jgi:hypothetical protein
VEKEPFFSACDQVFKNPLPRSRGRGEFDLELQVQRLPKLSPAFVYRRGVQMIAEALATLDHGFHPVSCVLHVPGCGELDLVEAQQRVSRIMQDGEPVLLWIDPETDLVKVGGKYVGFEGNTETHMNIATALGSHLERVFQVRDAPGPLVGRELEHDPVAGRFGISPHRNRRELTVDDGGENHLLTVKATNDSPVRGYVAFYVPVPMRIDVGMRCERVRASEGVAALEVPRFDRSYSVGAVVEDEGTVLEAMLETRSEPPTTKTKKRPRNMKSMA